MAELITKGLKQAKYVIDFLNEWKGAGSHSMSDVQAALLSAIQLSGLQPDAAIVDADPCNSAVLTPTLTAVVPLESKQDLKNALPEMKTCNEGYGRSAEGEEKFRWRAWRKSPPTR